MSTVNVVGKRPTSVSIVAWIIIVTSVISLASSYASMNNPLVQEMMAKSAIPVSLQYAMMYVGLTLSLVTGVAMLKGRHWGRVVYVGWSVFGAIVALTTSPAKLIVLPGLVLLAIYAFFLFRPNANAYFRPAVAANDA